MMTRLTTIILFLLLTIVGNAQKLTVESMNAAPFDLSAAAKPVNDYNGVACGLVKVRLVSPGAIFGGNVMQPVEYKTGEYWVYMTAGSHLLQIKHPNFLPLDIDFRNYGIQRVESNCTYILTLVMPSGGQANVDDGMRYLVMRVKPANATVTVDGKIRSVHDGTVSVLLPMGVHSYRVEAEGYLAQEGTVEVADGKKSIDVTLESALAQVTVSCPTAGARIYVNENLMGNAPWSGQLTEGNYQIEARLDGYRPQRQSVVLAQRESRNINLPALTAITGNINVDYLPADAEVWIDGKKVGTSPDIFRNILVGNHNIEVRANGYQTDMKTVTVNEGETTQLSGGLKTLASSGSNAITSPSNATVPSSNAIASSSNATMPVPEAVDLGLSVKWASFNLGASKPEEPGYYYKWGETRRADTGGWKTYEYAKGDYDVLTKYCTDASSGYNGFTDGKTKLEPMDDAATANLGGSWRMPTENEIQELINKCKFDWITADGTVGLLVVGPNENTIFLPASSYRNAISGRIDEDARGGYYWSASVNGSRYGRYAFHLSFSSIGWSIDEGHRADGLLVRPVLAE